jgi:hypothetical protein
MTSASDGTVPTTAPTSAARPAHLSLQKVVDGIRRNESQFQNLYIRDFKTTIDTRAAADKEWKPTPLGSSGSAWYDSAVNGKARIFFSPHVSRWEGGNGPRRGNLPQIGYSAQIMDASWNGVEGREINIAGGLVGQPLRHDNQAMIRFEPSVWFSSRYTRYETGLAYTLQYFVFQLEGSSPPTPRVLLSDQITKALESNPPQLQEETVNGFDTIRVAWNLGADRGIWAYWLSPEHNFAIVKYQLDEVLPGVVDRHQGFDVLKLKEVAPNTWFPLRAISVVAIPGRTETYYRYNFEAADAVANDPKFDTGIFKATLPAGYVVSSDQKGHQSYVVMPDGTLEKISVGQVLPNVRTVPATRPDADRSTAPAPKIQEFQRRRATTTPASDQL